MATVCFYFQIHQPRRLRRFSIFHTGFDYFDDEQNRTIAEKVATKCYLPAADLLLSLIEQYPDQFRIAFSITGCILEQWRQFTPAVIDRFKQLAATGCVEFLSETYHHSLAFLYSKDEFGAQVRLHRELIESLFGYDPTTFRHTELIYNNALAAHLAKLDHIAAVLAEGADQVLQGRSPNVLYQSAGNELPVLLKNYRLSDDIAFRFSNQSWPDWPLTAEKFATSVTSLGKDAELCNLFMDFETFGEHQWEDTGIFRFLQSLPAAILDAGHRFATPSQIASGFSPADRYDTPAVTSWADTERDLSAWAGNAMQTSALRDLYRLEKPVKDTGDRQLLADWRYLTTSDHFYYMCTKYFADQDVHRYFSPYESPYDSYINFMNVLDNLRCRVETPAR